MFKKEKNTILSKKINKLTLKLFHKNKIIEKYISVIEINVKITNFIIIRKYIF